jgi:hypothetical protein
LELFDAVVKGDIKTIEKLTIKQQIGKQVRYPITVAFCLKICKVHVCCSSDQSGRSPLDLAIELNNSKVATRILEIAIDQYTPLKLPTKEKKDDQVPLINNYELANLMRNLMVNYFRTLKNVSARSIF